MKINTTIIGLGKIGMGYDYSSKKRVRSHCNAVYNSKNFKLVSVADVSERERKRFKTKYKKVTAYEKFSEALDDTKPKLVIVATPINTHFSILKSLIKRKYIKYILCEKPITDSIKKTKKILKMIKTEKKLFFVNYIRQSDLVIDKVLKTNKKSLLNDSSKISVYYYDSIYNNCSHFIVLFIKLFGIPKKISNIKSFNKNNQLNVRVNFSLIFKNDKIVNFISKVENKDNINYEIEINLPKKKIKFYFSSNKILIVDNKKKILNTNMQNSQKNVLKRVFLHLNKKKKYPIDTKDALYTEVLLDKLTSKL